ncbi:MAG: hypothetical protein HY819_20015 [Acidobacteria bacterium]|nr:hypothetical protein [Acidobacteriota bacterium]
MEKNFFQNKKAKIFFLLWLLAIFFGLYLLNNHANSPSKSAIAPTLWPQETKLSLSKSSATVILFAHPKCPCTRATLGELAKFTTQTQNKAKVYVLFTKPKNSPDDWQQTDILEIAKNISGVEIKIDPGGEEANLFQTFTSGQTLVYNPQGKLLFSGGITSARGHSGDNLGLSAITSIINKNITPIEKTPVFGCTLCLPNSGNNAPSK